MRRSDREVKEFEDIIAIMEKCDVLGRGADKDLLVLEQEAVIRYVEETIRAMNGENKAF